MCVDLNPALVTKCITGTEQDFILLMNRAKDFIESMFPKTGLEEKNILLEMFRECVFGYYVLTPLIVAKDVSDIKVLDFDHIVVKANGERYVTDIRFSSEEDYKSWYERIHRIQKLGRTEEFALGHSTDRKDVTPFICVLMCSMHALPLQRKTIFIFERCQRKSLPGSI